MSIPILTTIQQGITRYAMPTMVTIANVCNMFTIVIFLQKHHRTSSCSIYLIFAAVASIISVNWAIIPIINALNNPPDLFSQSLVLCRLRGYVLQVVNNLYRTFLVLACIDRYAMSSSSVRIRRWATIKVARPAITISIVSWLLIPIHILVWQSIEKSKCSTFGTYATVYTIYLLIVIFTPFCLISFFGCLTIRNLTRLRRRVHPLNVNGTIASEHRRKRDIDLQRMVVTEVLVYLILTSAYPVVFLYTTLTANITDKSDTRLQIESFISFISNSFLQYLNSGSRFFIYFSTSHTFRAEVKKLVFFRHRRCRNNNDTVPLNTIQRGLAARNQVQRLLPS